jgi:glycosyltransferase involved in cell wall biosynthesis
MSAAAGCVSVVVPALNEGSNLIDTVGAVFENSGGLLREVIVVDDGSTDSGPERTLARHRNERLRVIRLDGAGIARARNAGGAAAEGDAIVFLDAHCHVPEGWLEPLVGALDAGAALAGPSFTSIRDPRMRACGVTWADPGLGNVWLPPGHGIHAVPFHIGACQAVRADVFRETGGFDDGMTRWGSEDIELCLRLWLLGHEVAAAPESLVFHLFRTTRPYDVDVSAIVYNHLRLALLHFDEGRLASVIRYVFGIAGAERSLAKAYANGTLADRSAMLARHRRDLDWLFGRFGIGF